MEEVALKVGITHQDPYETLHEDLWTRERTNTSRSLSPSLFQMAIQAHSILIGVELQLPRFKTAAVGTEGTLPPN